MKRTAVVVAMLAALILTGKAAPSTPASPAADQATAYQLDATHDGYMADAGLAAPLTQAWSVTLPGAASYPLIVDGMVFVTGSDEAVYALNQATGSTIWSHALGGKYAWSGIAYDRGRVFAVNSDGVLTAFDAATGSVAWSEQFGDPGLFSAPPTAANGIVYVGGESALRAVRESNGSVLWTQPVTFGDISSPAVTPQGVYVSYDGQQVYDFDPFAGTLLWHRSNGFGGSGKTPVVANGHVYVRDGSGNLILSSSTGATQGSFTASRAPAVANNEAFIFSGSIGAGGTLSAISNSGLGTQDWTFSGDGNLDTAPLVVGGLVFVGSFGESTAGPGELYALDAATGATSWSTSTPSIPLPEEHLGSTVLNGLGAANGTLVLPASNKLIAYRTAGAITDAPSNQSPPTIDGSGFVSQVEAADVGIWSGLPNAYAYQWELCDAAGANCADIAGATGLSFVPPAGDSGSTLRVKVVATNGVGSSTSVESAASAVLGVAAPPAISASPTVSGTATVGQQLSTTTGTWTNAATSFEYKWQRCDNTGANCVDIANATSSQYTPVAADAGYEIRSEVLASNEYFVASGYAPSAPTSAVLPIVVPTFTAAPLVSGTAVVGQPLSTTNGTWANAPTSYAYKWQRCTKTGLSCISIVNATSSQYKLVAADVGHEVRSEVIASNVAGPAASGYAPSAPTSVVATKPVMLTLPKLSGVPKVGKSLRVTKGTWKNSPATYAYQWLRCTSAGTSCKVIAGATRSAYRLRSADLGHKLEAKVTPSNAAGPAVALSNKSGVVKK